jgi:hypothetical protein
MEEKDGQQQQPPQMQENHLGREHEMMPTPCFIRSTYKLAGKLKVQLSDYSFYFSLYCQPIANSALPLICALAYNQKTKKMFILWNFVSMKVYTH